MRTAALLVLVTAFLSVGTGGIRHSNRMSFGGFMSSTNANVGTARVGSTSGDNDAAELLQPFQQKDTEYSFIYNAQIASGLQSAEQSAANPQQKAVTRIQCLANIHFVSERHAQLRLEQCRVGQQNGKMSQPQEVQPMEAFEDTNIAEQTKQQLQTPCQFSFADGVIERVQCPQDAEEWSKNVKKAVLNIIQMNLKQNNAQGLHKSGASHAEQFQQELASGQGKSFKIPEITVEGACQTMYTINKAQRIGHQQQQQQQFNVTKTINFKKCQKIADVANGFQADQPQGQCAQCQQYWAQQQNAQNSPTDQQQKTNAWQMGESDQHPCAKCDPKEVKENEMDRSTVIRCRIAGDPADQYALRGCELRSQYIYRSWKSAEAGTNGAVMQTVVVANLEAVAVKPKNQQIPAINGASEHDTLMYSNDKAVDEKRFFANGDNEFGTDGKGSPFARVPKVQQAKQALLKLEQYTENNHKGIDQQAPVQQQRLVEMLRMCTEKELKQVEEHCANAPQQPKQKRGEKCQQMMANALAQCGTRNCVAELARKIKNGQVVQSVAVQSLLALNQLPSPSDAILDEMQQLCQSQTVAGSQALKQSCWLAFGALVNEVCQHTTAQNAKECAGESGAGATAKCVQSGFVNKDKCPADKKQKYKETLFALYKQQNEQQQTQCIYDKAVALGALGNAGLDIALADLEQIIKDTREARVVRMMAIDATRRMRTQMPHSVRAMLLPVFLNTGEQPQVRITAFANILGAQPTAEVVDQLMYAIGKEPNREVQAYCYRTMKTMANSQKPGETQIAKHVKSSLKLLANAVDEQQLRTSGKWQFEQLYNNAQREGVFMSFVHAVSSRSALPAYAHVQLDSHFNDHYTYNKLNMYMVQQEAEQWYERAMNSFGNSKRKQKQQHGSKQLRTIYEQLGIKSHRSDFGTMPMAADEADNDNEAYQQQQQQQRNNMRPFAMLGLRSNNVDKAFIALDEHTIGEQTRRMLNGEEMKPNWAAILFGHGAQQQQLDMAIVQNMGEKEAKIATSAGVALRILSTTPMMANIEGRVGAKASAKTGPSAAGHGLSAQFQFNAMSARMAQIQKMELITPFAVSGVESIRSLHINLPLQGELSLVNSEQQQQQQQQGISIKVKLPQRGTQLASAHSLPFTFIAKAEPSAQFVREPRQIIAVHDPKLDQQQREVNAVLGQKAMALPLHIRGHYHVPAEPFNLLQFAQLLMATENAVHVQYQPNEESPRELTIRASGEHFRKAAQMQLPDTPQLHNFYAQQFHSSSSSCDSYDSVNAANCEEDEAEQQQQQGENGGEQYISNNDNQQQQQQQLNSFISAYKPHQQYAHALRLNAQTSGGARDATAHANIQAQCDERMRYCTVQADANANQQWTLSAQAQMVMPDTVPSVEQLQQPTMLKQFIALAKAQWGDQQDKQHINVRIRGTQAHTEQTRAVMAQIQQQQQGKRHGFSAQQQRKMLQRSAFLNQFHVEATYALKAYAQNMMNRGLELLKSAYFWNTKSQLLSGPNAPKNGKIAATISIDPLKPSNANVTIRTPEQQLRMQQIQMPAVVGRPFALIRQQSAQQTHSLAQLFYKQFSLKSRAQCIVDGRNVDTFDGFAFTAPLSSNCFSVLAKHCSSPMEEQQQQPQFVVMLKKVPGKQNANKSAQKADKVLKVITAEQQIECQPKTAQGKKGQMICKVNGQPISGDEQCQDELQQQQGEPCVQFNDQRQTDVTIRTGPIAVRFNGRKAWLKVSQAYKNAQCGLCGHYDDADEQEQELRMANGQIASNLAEFHRSYALKDAEQCTQQALNSFYNEEQQQQQQQQHNVAYGHEQQTEDGDNFYGQFNQWKINSENGEEDAETEQYNDREEDNDDNNNNDSFGEAEEEEEQFDGQIEDISDENWAGEEDNEMSGEEQTEKCCCCCAKEKDEAQKQKCQRKCQQSDECRRKCQQKQCQQQQQQQQRKTEKKQKQGQSSALKGQWEAVSPTLNTKVYEQNHALCFSTEPVKQCPRGTTTNRGEEADQQQSEEKPKRVRFVCMDRAESEARHLMRQLRRGQRSIKVSGAQGESFTEEVDEPQRCWRRRN
ncbi:hypothetical protein niasHS_014145 [Heterodera schachtii]|uniref:Vitellogenin n=1 Tax=Heterodera schachtii TaxID=97005 RepID=A0ABD2J2M6_HETSC